MGLDEPEYEDFLRHPRRSGYVVDRARFDDRLHAAAAAAGVEFVSAPFAGIERTAGVRLASDDGVVEESLSSLARSSMPPGVPPLIARRKGARVTIRES